MGMLQSLTTCDVITNYCVVVSFTTFLFGDNKVNHVHIMLLWVIELQQFIHHIIEAIIMSTTKN